MGRDLGGDADAVRFGASYEVDAAGGAEVGDVDVGAGLLREGDVARDHVLLGRGGNAAQAEAGGDPAFVHDTAVRKAGVL